MRVKILKLSATAIVLLCVVALISRQQQRTDRAEREVAALREQLEQVTSLQHKQEDLADQLEAARAHTQADALELARLRGQASRLRKLEEENARLNPERERLSKLPMPAEEEADPDEYSPGHEKRVRRAMRWALAASLYAKAHQGQFPASLQEAIPFLGAGDVLWFEKEEQAALTVDQYELLYFGRSEDMTNPPPEKAILIRETHPVQTRDGSWIRCYSYGNAIGASHLTPDGDFQRWESERIPKTDAQ